MTVRLDYATAYLHVTADTLRRMASRNELPGAFKVGRRWLLNPVAFHRWLDRQGAFTFEPEVPSGRSPTILETDARYENLLAQAPGKKRKAS